MMEFIKQKLNENYCKRVGADALICPKKQKHTNNLIANVVVDGVQVASSTSQKISDSESNAVTLLNNQKLSDYDMFLLVLCTNNKTIVRSSTLITRDMLVSGGAVAEYWACAEGWCKYNNSDDSVIMFVLGNGYSDKFIRLYGVK